MWKGVSEMSGPGACGARHKGPFPGSKPMGIPGNTWDMERGFEAPLPKGSQTQCVSRVSVRVAGLRQLRHHPIQGQLHHWLWQFRNITRQQAPRSLQLCSRHCIRVLGWSVCVCVCVCCVCVYGRGAGILLGTRTVPGTTTALRVSRLGVCCWAVTAWTMPNPAGPYACLAHSPCANWVLTPTGSQDPPLLPPPPPLNPPMA